MATAPGDEELVEVTEGRARLRVPAGNKARGPGAKGEGAFFNPAMAFSRDLSVLLLSALAGNGWRALDGLAATGARAVRLAAEVPGLEVTANDWNPAALALAEANAKANGVPVTCVRRNLGALLWESMWHYVDVDPFGSPAGLVDAATRSVKNHGLLAVTATDTTALHGVYPNVCRRRYLATPMRGEIGHEIALRILAGAVVRQGLKHDRAFRPVLAHATDHYYRVYLSAARGAGRADAAAAEIGHAFLCPACGERGVTPDAPGACPSCGARDVRVAGPLWTGRLQDADVVTAVEGTYARHAPHLARAEDVRRFIAFAADEAVLPPLFHHLHHASSRAGVDVPATERVLDGLRDAGFRAGRAHVDPVAVKTDADVTALTRVLRDVGTRRKPAHVA